MAINFYQVKKTINGKEYTAQFAGISTALKAVDQSYIEGSNNISNMKLAEYLFKNILVEPKNLTVDDFESLEEFNEVVSFARGVMSGDFRKKDDQNTNKTKGKE